MELLILIGTGALAGILAGLMGIGGGLVIVPLLALVFENQGVSIDVLMHVAIGTSLATIVTTALSSIRAHQKRKAIDWAVFRMITPGVIAGAMLGALIADALRGEVLKVVFACFLFLVAAQMALGRTPPPHRQLPGRAGIMTAGILIGTVSGLVGIGGGSMSVPFLTWCNVIIHRAIATSAAIGLPIAVSGALSYIVTGWHAADLPPWSLGYINLPAYLGIVVASTLFAPLGAALAHRLPPLVLKRVFALFLLILGIKMLL